MEKSQIDSIFENGGRTSVQLERAGYSRKPNGSQDQGTKDENE